MRDGSSALLSGAEKLGAHLRQVLSECAESLEARVRFCMSIMRNYFLAGREKLDCFLFYTLDQIAH